MTAVCIVIMLASIANLYFTLRKCNNLRIENTKLWVENYNLKIRLMNKEKNGTN